MPHLILIKLGKGAIPIEKKKLIMRKKWLGASLNLRFVKENWQT
jgi:hypothetical protein